MLTGPFDWNTYPHLLDQVVAHSDRPTFRTLRFVSSWLRECVDEYELQHLMLWREGTVANYGGVGVRGPSATRIPAVSTILFTLNSGQAPLVTFTVGKNPNSLDMAFSDWADASDRVLAIIARRTRAIDLWGDFDPRANLSRLHVPNLTTLRLRTDQMTGYPAYVPWAARSLILFPSEGCACAPGRLRCEPPTVRVVGPSAQRAVIHVSRTHRMPLALLTILGVRDIDLLLSLEPTAPAETWVFTELIDAAATAINVLLRNNPEAQFTLLMHQGRWKPVIERGKLNIYEQLARALCIAPAFEMGDYNPFPDYADSERGRARKRARISSDRSLSTAPQTRKEISPLAEVMRRIRFQSFDMRRHVVLEEQLWSTETQAMALTLELNEFFTL